ncbi:hypothetical protein GWC77_25710 [Paraburkholderia sp. NMBU_R16]|uniref:RDD family protein n=1 Tax=Paraburkholderia sp. NMBU_R16 TaxID=2698676 RepID=UPI0015676D71|nr:RDD family protein [Paraburkholderia sp. NMBU_R16]NRO99287.1 hypothetical protein [Paraburkholderia sp. NMBU_R16]
MNAITGEPDDSRPTRNVVGFWRRSFAFWLDGLILALIGLALIVLAGDALMRLGQWGKLIGFAIGALYFTFLEGAPGRGQSLGKRLMNIKVARLDPTGLGPVRYSQAWLRYAIVGVPTVLGGSPFIGSMWNAPAWQWLVLINGVLLAVWLFALGYLYLFNRPTRRTLQDLATSTIVVPVAATTGTRTPVRPLHWNILAGVAIVIAIGAGIGMHFMSPTFRELGRVQQAVSTVPGVGEVGVSVGTSRMSRSQGGTTTTRGAAISFTLPDSDLHCEQISPQVAKAALLDWPEAADQDYLSVICIRSIELGIVHWRNQSATVHSPGQWAAQFGLRM